MIQNSHVIAHCAHYGRIYSAQGRNVHYIIALTQEWRELRLAGMIPQHCKFDVWKKMPERQKANYFKETFKPKGVVTLPFWMRDQLPFLPTNGISRLPPRPT